MDMENRNDKKVKSGELNIDKEHSIIESALQDVIDFVGYIDIDTHMLHIVRWLAEPQLDEKSFSMDYDQGVDKVIQKYLVEEDRIVCGKMFQLPNIIDTVDKFGEFTGVYRVDLPNMPHLQYKKISMHYLDLDERDVLVVTQHDFTNIVREESQMQEALRGALHHAEEASQAKSKFLFHMSHELRTPLNSIVGMTELGKGRTQEKDYVEYCFDKIDVSSRMMLDMIDDVLDIAHIENDDIKLAENVVLFRPFIEGVAEKARANAYAKKINFQLNVDEGIAKSFNFDAERFSQVLRNLLSNAVKYTQRFGSVELNVKLIGEEIGRQSLEFEVKDTGVGIDDHFKSKVFEAFEQEYDDSTSIYGGAGLGLAICNHIVKKMGGEIEFESTKGQGSTFRVEVDLDIAVVAQPKEDDLQQELFIDKRVLLADDNAINLEIDKQLLTKKGMVVDVAENGRDALSQYMSNAPGTYDLILMDVRMPYMDGLTATSKIRASGKSDCKTIPILALTANAFEEDIRKSFECGMNAHITKPVDVKAMFSIIQQALQGKLTVNK
ncbi:MAG: response regulator [Anaerovibrio sp.]|uniref:ATP-binding protein n=1 Tax=Anaerovibrio sp. TaxID=1872532 RepID=UPI0025FB6DE9|nr:ATP-binding protein [Anaerovibrio sp.]MCR5175232.1 response regulator [Anaerovibrio sp.]